MEKLKAFIKKYYEGFAYLFFGGLATLLNLVLFAVFQAVLGTGFATGIVNVLDNIICILFAYWTNRTFVFRSKNSGQAALAAFGQFVVNANAVRNHLEDTVHFRCANVLDELPKLAEAGEKYDVVILDPPAFTKSREATKNAIKGYREINMKGLKLVKDGGYLATCSCSHFMTQELLAKTVKEAAKAAHKRLRQVEFRTQAPDHPILWANSANVPESYYLKFFIFQVVDEK